MHQDVQITGVTGMAVEGEREAAHDHEFNAVRI
jgi:hypothetical protein